MYYSAVSELRPELQFRGVQTKIQRYTLLSQACKLLSQGYKQSVTPDYKTTDSDYTVLSHFNLLRNPSYHIFQLFPYKQLK